MDFFDLVKELRTGEPDATKAAKAMKIRGGICVFGAVWNYSIYYIAPFERSPFNLPPEYPYLALISLSLLGALCAANRGIMAIFMFQGFFIGLIGTVIGLVGGYSLSYILNTYQIIKLPPVIYYLSHLPVNVKFSDFAAVSISAILISFLSTIYPAWQAAKLDPIEPLRYE